MSNELNQWLKKNETRAELRTKHSRQLRLDLDRAERTRKPSVAEESCSKHGLALTPAEDSLGAMEAEKTWAALVALGGEDDGYGSYLGAGSPKRALMRDILWSAGLGFKSWLWAQGNAMPKILSDFADARLLGCKDMPGEGIGAMLFCQALISSDLAAAKMIASRMEQALMRERERAKGGDDLAIRVRTRALSVMAQCAPDPLKGRDEAMDEGLSLALIDALKGNFWRAADLAGWIEGKGKTWGSVPTGTWFADALAWMADQGEREASLDVESAKVLLERIDRGRSQKALSAWESSSSGAMTAPQGALVSFVQSLALSQSAMIKKGVRRKSAL